MKQSTDRILTTHVGSLPRSQAVTDGIFALERGESIDVDAHCQAVAEAVVDVVARQVAVGVDIVTVGQYLRPTSNHLPVARWWEPTEFDELKRIGEQELGLAHVEASPLTRSSYHAKQGEAAARA